MKLAITIVALALANFGFADQRQFKTCPAGNLQNAIYTKERYLCHTYDVQNGQCLRIDNYIGKKSTSIDTFDSDCILYRSTDCTTDGSDKINSRNAGVPDGWRNRVYSVLCTW